MVLDALWDDYQNTDSPQGTLRERSAKANFYRDRLSHLFFSGLNNPQEHDIANINGGGFLRKIIGTVPFLNGGLFEQEPDESNDKILISDSAIELIFTDLFNRFNFTVSESTPLDEEVAVDPEMLGKVFEELCNFRHDSGSYYTPKPIVSFMCREALKGYLINKVSQSSTIESSPFQGGFRGIIGSARGQESPQPPLERGARSDDAIARFVDDRDASELSDPELVYQALEEVKVCDPACGSGAYLLGMLHELLDLRECLFTSKNLGSETVYDRKLEIIEHNLYGVDKELFAVNIARLRLWLSLAVDFVGEEPKPLPNLKYKLEVGDSLLAPMAMAQRSARDVLIPRYRELKAEYLRTHHGGQKKELEKEIESVKLDIATLTHGGNNSSAGFDWAVEFAEVMADGGFDIQVANPPYVRQEKIIEYKPQLKKVYPEIYNGTSDLYCYFYARSLQLLKPGGMLAFISSNKWFRAGYGEKLRKHIADTCQVSSITDFGELPVFKSAAVLTMIFICQSSQSTHENQFRFTQVKSLESPYPNVKEITERDGSILPINAIDGGNWLLTDNSTAKYIKQMETRGIPLGEYVNGQIYYGVKTGFNQAFVIDSMTRDKLIFEDPSSKEIIKPLVVGDDVRKWHTRDKDRYLIFTRRGIKIDNYPAIKKYLQRWQKQLEPKPRNWDNSTKWEGRKAGSYKWYEIQDEVAYYQEFDRPKIIYPDICQTSRFTFDNTGVFVNDTNFIIPCKDLYLLGVLNSSYMWKYLKSACSEILCQSMRMKRIYLSNVPIHQASDAEKKVISKLVQKCLDAKGVGCEKWEQEIDILVGRLYGFEHNHDLN